MGRERSDRDTEGSGADRANQANTSPHYALLAGGLATTVAAVVLTIDGRLLWGVYASTALLILEVGMVTATLLLSSTKKDSALGAATPSPSAHSKAEVTGTFSGPPGVEAHPGNVPELGWRTKPSGAGQVSRSAPSKGTSPGDQLWSSWTSSVGRLPVDLAPPVPETAYIAPREGVPRLYEEGEPLILDGSFLREPQGWQTSAESGGILSLPSPSLSSSEIPPAPELKNDLPRVPAFLSDPHALGVDFVVATPLLHEALNPTPPHLRSGSKRAVHHRSPSADSRPAPYVRCADCRKVVPNPKSWRCCSDCHSQLCSHCIVEALLRYEWAWCTHCAGVRSMDSLQWELAPATGIAIPRSSSKVPMVPNTALTRRLRRLPATPSLAHTAVNGGVPSPGLQPMPW